VFPTVACFSGHENQGARGEENGDGEGGVGEVHDAVGFEGEDGDAVVEAEEVDVGADAFAGLVDVGDHLVKEGFSVEEVGREGGWVMGLAADGAANGVGQRRGPRREVLEAEAHGLVDGGRGEPVLGLDGCEYVGLAAWREEIGTEP